VFMVSAPRVITGLSWCRPERTVKHVPLRATDFPLVAENSALLCRIIMLGGAYPCTGA